jgi:hypothetical protein
MLFVVERGGRSFVELAKVQDCWEWRSGMIGSVLKVGSRNFGMFVLDKECCWFCGAHCMVWLTSLECNCIEGWVVSWFILRLVSM